MFLERFEDKGLSHYSYVVGCDTAGRAAVIDPRRDVDVYLEFARARDVSIAYVLETHIHADFASGARELAARSGATLVLSAYDRGERYEASYPHQPIADRERLEVGSVVIEARHTPGHTPEHLSFLIYDTTRSATTPTSMLTGDFLFVGSVGRPDLLGEEAKDALARELFRSVRTVLADLPDGLEILPAHGAGSMCGSGMSGRALSTLGFERIANPYLRPELDEDRFVHMVLGSVPPFPAYYRRMKQLNADGPPPIHDAFDAPAIPASQFAERLADGHVVIDLRDQLSFGAGHIPGSFGIGAGYNLSTWAAWTVPYETPLLLVASSPSQIEGARRALYRVGLDDVRGCLDGGIDAWVRGGHELAQLRQITPRELDAQRRSGGWQVLDVRGADEWASGHIEGALHVMAGEVPSRLEEIADLQPLALICGSGYRSTVVGSVLERAGIREIVNVTGGMHAWKQAGLPTVK